MGTGFGPSSEAEDENPSEQPRECEECREELPATAFRKRSDGGRAPVCRDCVKNRHEGREDTPHVTEEMLEDENKIPADAQPYWMGVVAAAPRFFFHLGGQTLHMQTMKVTELDYGEHEKDRMLGGLAHLTPQQVEAIKADAYTYVCRVQGYGANAKRKVIDRRSTIASAHYDMDGKRSTHLIKQYRPHALDHPVACYIWLIPWADREKHLALGKGLGNIAEPPAIEPLPKNVFAQLVRKPSGSPEAETWEQKMARLTTAGDDPESIDTAAAINRMQVAGS